MLWLHPGIRIGAIPLIRLRSLENNKLTIYENSKEEYTAFITPECKKAIDFYLDFRQRYGEKITDNSFLIREQFNIRDEFAIRNPRQVQHKTIQWNLRVLAIKCGIRKNAHKHARQKVMMSHGFRKFFTNQMVNSNVKSEIRDMMLGHKIGLVSAYYRPTVQEMYDEYDKSIDNLTIDEENRLRKKVETLKIEKSRIDMLEAKIQKLEKKHGKII